MTNSYITPTQAILAELAVGGVAGHVSQLLGVLPGWAGGMLAALLVAVISRLLAPTIDVHALRLKRRLTQAPAEPPSATHPPPDEPDASG